MTEKSNPQSVSSESEFHYGFGEPQTQTFLSEYEPICEKMKKKLFRKPKFAEISEEFEALGSKWQSRGFNNYAATCYLSTARCQQILQKPKVQIQFLIKAGRLYMETFKKYRFLKLNASILAEAVPGIDSFDKAIALCHEIEEYKVMSGCLALELALILGPCQEGINFCKVSKDKYPTIWAYDKLASFYIESADYYSALESYTELVKQIETVYDTRNGYIKQIMHRVEITRVFLLLIVQPSPLSMTPEYTELLEKYNWDELDDPIKVPLMTEDEMILMQSVVIGCQNKEYIELCALEYELWEFLDTQQKGLLRTLIERHRN